MDDPLTWQLDETGPEAYERFLVGPGVRPARGRELAVGGAGW
jgi:hypothetical protein